ncbi:MAG: CinA family nicotinamide mononucleotide deamidase-related protein, partial [Bacillota bacterium]
MKADLLCIGSELLTGLVENTNAGYLARRLGSAGIEIREQRVVADELDTIAAAIAEALRQSEIVICTGGLGPTDDDMTREAAAKLLQREFTADPNWLRKLACFFGERGLTMPEANRKQAMVINGSTLLDNSRGTAPGAMVETDGRLLFLLPGPPQELQPMFEETVLPVLKSRVKDEIFLVKTVKCSGLGESLLEEKLKTLDKWENPALSLAARGTEVHLQLKARGGAVFAQKLIAEATRRLYHALAGFVYGEDEETLAGVVAALFVQSQKTLALAESCSGGLLADLLTDVPGSSRFFKGSLVA